MIVAPTEDTQGAVALQNKLWQWQRTEYRGEITPVPVPQSYTLTFNSNNTFEAQLDCNSGSGQYEANDTGSLKFDLQITTLAFCGELSRHDDMVNMLAAVQNYRLEDNGNTLVLIWPADGPVEYFTNAETDSDTQNSPENATYLIEGQPVTLVNGKAEVAIPGSSAMVTTELWGVPAVGDLTEDAYEDTAVILVQNPGGSGTFYYVAANLSDGNDQTGTNAILLGDSIAIQNQSITDQQILVNYAERAEGEPMTASPSIGVSRYFEVQGTTLIEVQK